MPNERRMTRQRRLILEELAAVRTHPTADEIYALVRSRLPQISLGTVYRNLQVLAAEGQVRMLTGPGGRKRFDADLREHCHAHCLCCGRVTDLKSPPQSDLPAPPEAPEGFRLLGCRIEYVGLCAGCDANAENSALSNELAGDYITSERRPSRSICTRP